MNGVYLKSASHHVLIVYAYDILLAVVVLHQSINQSIGLLRNGSQVAK